MTDAASRPEPPVIRSAHDGVGRLTLNRPRAINALTLEMIRTLAAALDAWRTDPSIDVVVLDGAGERGFCAGGDVRSLYDEVRAGRIDGPIEFFRAEYALNAAIAEYPKPVVALADGITMGGGIGLAGHAAIRVVTERSRLAMPETRIGFTPDVGGTLLLARAPGRIGEFLGVTGTEMDAADAIYAGFADHIVASDDLDALSRSLSNGTSLSLAHTPGASGGDRLEAARPWIDDAFSADTIPEVIARLRARTEPRAAAAADTMAELAPTGMAVTLESVRRARELDDLRAVLAQEYGVVLWFGATQPDFLEGIRAQLVDKTRDPRWDPATPDEVPADAAASAFSWRPPVPLWG